MMGTGAPCQGTPAPPGTVRQPLEPLPPGPPSFRAQVSVSLGLSALLHLYSRVRFRLSYQNQLIY